MRRALALLSLLLLVAPTTGAPEPEVAGLLESLKGPVFLGKAGKKGPALDPDIDAGRVLLSGQELILERGGEATLRLDRKRETVRGPRVYKVPVVPPGEVGETLKAIRRFYARAGRERPAPTVILSPPDGAVVQPSTLRFEWLPSGGNATLVLEITDPNGNRLWRRANVPDIPSTLVDAEARQTLADYRKAGRQGPLVLELRTSAGAARQTSFSLLPEGEEKALAEELAQWQKEPADSPLRYIGPATAYGRRKMLFEAAAEYESGLKALPKSRALRDAALESQMQLGNLPRVRELLRR